MKVAAAGGFQIRMALDLRVDQRPVFNSLCSSRHAALLFLLCAACSSDDTTILSDADAAAAHPGGGEPDASAPGADAAIPTAAVPQGSWAELEPLPELPRFYVGVTATRGQVFVIGGLSEGPEAVAVQAYDVADDSWQRLADLPQPMGLPNVATVGDRLFVLGAFGVSDAYEYDFENDAWLDRAPVPVAVGPGGAAVAVRNSVVLLAGGAIPGRSANLLNTGLRVDGFYGYDTARDRWETLPALPVAVGYAMGALMDDQFWVIGGSDNTERTERTSAFDIASETWVSKPALPISISSAAVGVLDGRIYVAGGIASSTGVISGLTIAFDEQSQSWGNAAALPTPRFGMGGAVWDGKLYVPTGIEGQGPTEFVPVGTLEVFSP